MSQVVIQIKDGIKRASVFREIESYGRIHCVLDLEKRKPRSVLVMIEFYSKEREKEFMVAGSSDRLITIKKAMYEMKVHVNVNTKDIDLAQELHKIKGGLNKLGVEKVEAKVVDVKGNRAKVEINIGRDANIDAVIAVIKYLESKKYFNCIVLGV